MRATSRLRFLHLYPLSSRRRVGSQVLRRPEGSPEHERERENPSEYLQSKVTWTQLKVSPRCFLPLAKLYACVCPRVATLFIEPTRFMRVELQLSRVPP